MWDWQFALEIFPDLLRASWITIQSTFFGMSIALIIGLIWAILRRSQYQIISRIITLLVDFIRSTPLLVQLYFFFFVMPDFGVKLSPFLTGILALALHYSAYMAEVYRAGIERVPKGQWEAAISLNLSRWHTWRAIILPQAIPPMIPVLGNYLIAMFKDTPLLAAITVTEMLQTAKLIGSRTFRYLEPLTLVGILFLVVSLLSSQIISKLEERFADR